MEIDAIATVAAVRRRLDTTDRDGRPARVLVAERTYPTSIEDLWEALTDAGRIPRWFMPVTGDLRVGGRYQLEGNAGGEILACDPPRRFEITWDYGEHRSWVTVELRGEPGGDVTELQLRHTAPVSDGMWEEFGPGAVGLGWELGLVGLGLHVTTGSAVVAKQGMEWQTSDNARDFIARASDAWCETSVAFGTAPDAARAAADRVTAAYTATE